MSYPNRTNSAPAAPEPPSFPFRRTCPFQPPAEYRRLRESAPVSRAVLADGEEVWLVTRHEDVRAVLTDKRISAATPRPGFGDKPLGPQPEPRRMTFIQMDPPEHGVQRSMLLPEFTRRRINDLRPGVERVAETLIDDIVAGPSPVDLVRRFALPLSSLTICQLLGVPYEDNEFFQSRTAAIHDLSAAPAQRLAAREAMHGYLDEQIRRKEANPGDDLLSRLIIGHVPSGVLTHEELVSMAMLLLVAGHDTTANMVSLGILTLLGHPGLADRVRTEPDALTRIVEELLRYHSIADLVTCRVAGDDIDLGGTTIRAGERIMALGASANHDERIFARPEQFDAERPERRHVAFGFGVHQCIGQNLARMELEVAYRAIFTRLPQLRLAVPLDRLRVKDTEVVFGLRELPVDW